MLRRSHKKSRAGCLECKRRHVKVSIAPSPNAPAPLVALTKVKCCLQCATYRFWKNEPIFIFASLHCTMLTSLFRLGSVTNNVPSASSARSLDEIVAIHRNPTGLLSVRQQHRRALPSQRRHPGPSLQRHLPARSASTMQLQSTECRFPPLHAASRGCRQTHNIAHPRSILATWVRQTCL